jgi:hypothetical protein
MSEDVHVDGRIHRFMMTPPSVIDVVPASAVAIVAPAALFVANHKSDGTLFALAMVSIFWPLLLVIPSVWSGRISQERGALVGWEVSFGAGLCAITVAAFAATRDDSFPATAAIMGGAAAFFVIASVTQRTRSGPVLRRPFAYVAASAAACFGVIADDYQLGWHTLTYGIYGLSAYVAVAAWLTPTEQTDP